jgi:hypothetical protein
VLLNAKEAIATHTEGLMKKIFIFLFILPLLFTLLGCDLLGTGQWLSPPGWIQGTWEGPFSEDTYSFQFTSDNAILNISGQERNFRNTHIRVSDSSSGTQYTINGIELDGSSTTYIFTKISDTVVNCSISAKWVNIPLMVLTKQ